MVEEMPCTEALPRAPSLDALALSLTLSTHVPSHSHSRRTLALSLTVCLPRVYTLSPAPSHSLASLPLSDTALRSSQLCHTVAPWPALVDTVAQPARPFVGVFKGHFFRKRGRFSPNVDKNEEMAPRTRTGYPHEGPCVGVETRATQGLYAYGNTQNLDSMKFAAHWIQ